MTTPDQDDTGPDSATGTHDPDGPDTSPDTSPDTAQDDPDTFDRAYVQRLRDDAAKDRIKAKRADQLAVRLVTAMAGQTNRLADPTDLPYDPGLLDDDGMPDPDKVAEAIEQLLARKPHLASRRPQDSNVGQGAQAQPDTFSLADLLRRGA